MTVTEKINSINAENAEEYKKLESLYFELGKNYYGYVSMHRHIPSELYNDVKAVSDSLLVIDMNNRELDRLAHAKACPKCGVEVFAGSAFCINCGTKVAEISENACTHCGTILSEGATFCHICGKKVEKKEPVAAEAETVSDPVMNICKNCGKELEEGVAFCTNCGTKIGE